jgi:hypothetical protein
MRAHGCSRTQGNRRTSASFGCFFSSRRSVYRSFEISNGDAENSFQNGFTLKLLD